MTPFSFEHVFRAGSAQEVLAAYFDPGHQAEQDEALGIAEREVLEQAETGEERRRVCRVIPRRQLPPIARAVIGNHLNYVETATWTRTQGAIAIEVRFGTRVQVIGTYRLAQISRREIRRTYVGHVSVDMPLIGARIERGIVAELEASMPKAAACTQTWVDRRLPLVAART